MEPTAQALRRVSLFKGLPDTALARIGDVVRTHTYAPGETIIFEGDPCEAVYFIAEGQVRVYRLSPNGREQDLARLGPGQTFCFTIRDEEGTHQGTLEVSQDVTHIRALEGERRLLDEG